MSRVIAAVDTTVYHTSIALMMEGNPKPRCGRRVSRTIVQHHPAAEMEKQSELAESVVEAVTRKGKPELVMLVEPVVGTQLPSKGQKGDTSARRRLGVHWELVRQLHAEKIPVAELPLKVLERAVVGRAARGMDGVKPVEDWVHIHFPAAVRPADDDGNPDKLYRMTTVALAAVGCVVAGVPLPRAITEIDPLPVTEDLLRIIKNGGNFPPEFRITPDNHPADMTRREKAAAKRVSDRQRLERFIEKKREEELEFIRTAPLAELENLKPINPAARAALRLRLARAEDDAFEKALERDEV